VLGKNYTRATPLIKFPPACKFDLDGYAASNSATTAALYSAVLVPQGDPYDLLPPVSLQSSVNFNVSLIWPAAVALPSGFNARVGVILEGKREARRPVVTGHAGRACTIKPAPHKWRGLFV
jgi:hypothetical protein